MKRIFVATAALFALLAPALAQTKMKIGLTKTAAIGGSLYAHEQGWFKQAGLDVEIEFLDASASAMVLLASNQLQIIEGGLSASFYNALQQGLPVRMATDSVSSPTGHFLVLRADLADKVKTIADLRGRPVASNAPNSISFYEIAKILETAGMTLKDIDPKVVAFNQMEAAFKTKAIDAAILVNPWVAEIPRIGLGVKWIDVDATVKPSPIMISASFYNTDWARQNPRAVQAYYTAAIRSVRAYCDAYHNSTVRPAMIKTMIANGLAPDAEFLNRLQWTSRSPNGAINAAFVQDVQRWYISQGLLPNELPVERLIDARYAANAVKELGAYAPDNAKSELPGCR